MNSKFGTFKQLFDSPVKFISQLSPPIMHAFIKYQRQNPNHEKALQHPKISKNCINLKLSHHTKNSKNSKTSKNCFISKNSKELNNCNNTLSNKNIKCCDNTNNYKHDKNLTNINKVSNSEDQSQILTLRELKDCNNSCKLKLYPQLNICQDKNEKNQSKPLQNCFDCIHGENCIKKKKKSKIAITKFSPPNLKDNIENDLFKLNPCKRLNNISTDNLFKVKNYNTDKINSFLPVKKKCDKFVLMDKEKKKELNIGCSNQGINNFNQSPFNLQEFSRITFNLRRNKCNSSKRILSNSPSEIPINK